MLEQELVLADVGVGEVELNLKAFKKFSQKALIGMPSSSQKLLIVPKGTFYSQIVLFRGHNDRS